VGEIYKKKKTLNKNIYILKGGRKNRDEADNDYILANTVESFYWSLVFELGFERV
jgi:hypothetical protein